MTAQEIFNGAALFVLIWLLVAVVAGIVAGLAMKRRDRKRRVK